jgi:hypothetical protein
VQTTNRKRLIVKSARRHEERIRNEAASSFARLQAIFKGVAFATTAQTVVRYTKVAVQNTATDLSRVVGNH